MTTYLKDFVTEPTPQSEPLPGMIENSAGGYSYPVSEETRMARFLILGSEGGSYYATQRQLTKDNAANVTRLLENDTQKGLDLICEISKSGRAPKNSPALFAMALAVTHGHKSVRGQARERLPEVARTGSHLLEFISYADAMRGWGRALRETIAAWYEQRPLEDLVYQTVKYRDRNGWTHKDALRVSHPKAEGARNDLFHWITKAELAGDHPELELIRAYEQAKTATISEAAQLVQQHRLTWEMLPSETLQAREIWQAMAGHMPLTALVRNLATMTRNGAIAPMNFQWAVNRLERIGAGGPKIHPLNVLKALMTYKEGKGQRGRHEWQPVSQIVDALDAAFERSFQDAPQTGKRIYLGLDVSGSMSWGTVAGTPGLTPRMAACAMAMAIARREPNYVIRAFSDQMRKLNITARTSLTDAIKKTNALPYGGTDCALPMLDAAKNNIPVDCFIVLTDSETWYGKIHPAEALKQYRQQMGIPAKLVVAGMVSNQFTIADPEDAGMMDIVGFDSAGPALIADFINDGANCQAETGDE